MPVPVVDPDDWVTSFGISDALITAPPGCGKTELLAKRAAFLVRAGAVALPRQILAVTYSRKATANLSERLRRHLGPESSRHVYVTNFHRLGFRIARHHGPLVGYMPLDRPLGQSAPLSRIRNEVTKSHGIPPFVLSRAVRVAKCGPFSGEEVMSRLEAIGSWAVEYEERLRAEGRPDFDDAIRLGTLLLRHPEISAAYRQRFPIVMVDEAQDLAESHLEMIDGIGLGRTTFAGDRAQGIFGFAGAAPAEVYKRIERRSTVQVRLATSYRSAPAILAVVNWSSLLLGGDELKVAPEMVWPDPGHVAFHEFQHAANEAEWILDRIAHWQQLDLSCSIAVVVRSGNRRRYVDRLIRETETAADFWDMAAHKPQLVGRFRRFGPSIVREYGDGTAALDALLLRCAEDIPIEDEETMDELNEAIDSLAVAVAEEGLSSALSGIRTLADPNLPAPPGIHLLNGHLGKGQQFDKVLIVGMEEGHIPSYQAKTGAELQEELAVLHVMISRARDTLVFTRSIDVPNPNTGRSWIRSPSRWLGALQALAT